MKKLYVPSAPSLLMLTTPISQAKLTTEIEDLHTRAAERKAARTRIVEQQADVSMESGA